MEIRQYFFLLRKWTWLLILGALVGGILAFVITTRQQIIYETTAKVMIMGSPDQTNSTYYYSTYYDDVQRAKNYAQLITTQPVLQALSIQLGFDVSAGDIDIEQIQDSQILEIIVKNSNPEQAEVVANSLIDVFIEYNDSLQAQRFSSSENSLKAQIGQVESQIAGLQEEMSQISQETAQIRQKEVEVQITDLEGQIRALENEIGQLVLILTPSPIAAAQSFAPTPTVSAEQVETIRRTQESIREKQANLENLRKTLDLFQQVNLNLLVYGQSQNPDGQPTNQSQLQGTLVLYQQIYANLLNSYENIRLARLRSTPNVVKIEEAPLPTSPTQPQPIRTTAIGALIGMLMAGIIAFVVEYLDDTLKTPEDVNRALDLPVIGLIGEMERASKKKNGNGGSNVYVANNPRSPIAEAFRTLRTNLEFASVDRRLKTLLVTSADPSEGKTTIAVNLATAIAQGEKKVTIIDADLRRPSVHTFLNLPNKMGLSDVFRDPTVLATALATVGNPFFRVLTSGVLPPNPAELLGSEAMTRILDSITKESDFVIVDGPPFIVADPIVLSAKVDGVLLVIQPGATKIDSAVAMLEQLNRAGARVVGAVLNPISRKRGHYYSGRYRYYSEYYSRGDVYESEQKEKPSSANV